MWRRLRNQGKKNKVCGRNEENVGDNEGEKGGKKTKM